MSKVDMATGPRADAFIRMRSESGDKYGVFRITFLC